MNDSTGHRVWPNPSAPAAKTSLPSGIAGCYCGLVMRTAQGPFRMETTYTWSVAGPGATRMALRNRREPSGFSAVAAPVLASALRRANRADLASMKMETGAIS